MTLGQYVRGETEVNSKDPDYLFYESEKDMCKTHGRYPIHRLSMSKDNSSLLEKMLDEYHVNIEDMFGRTPLIEFVIQSDTYTLCHVLVLISHGADIHATDLNGYTALDFLEMNAHLYDSDHYTTLKDILTNDSS